MKTKIVIKSGMGVASVFYEATRVIDNRGYMSFCPLATITNSGSSKNKAVYILFKDHSMTPEEAAFVAKKASEWPCCTGELEIEL